MQFYVFMINYIIISKLVLLQNFCPVNFASKILSSYNLHISKPCYIAQHCWLIQNVLKTWSCKVSDFCHLVYIANIHHMILLWNVFSYWHLRPREIMVSCQSQSTQYLFSRHDYSSSRQHVDGVCEDDYINEWLNLMKIWIKSV